MRRRAIAIIAAAALALAGCSEATPDASTNSGGQADINDIEIGMSDSLAPSIKVPEGETFTEPQSQVIWEGTGAPLQDNQPLLLDIYGVSLKDGRELINTYDGLPKSYLLAREVLGDELYETLIDSNVGTRVKVVAPTQAEGGIAPSANADGMTEPDVALVVDVLADRAVGDPIEPRADLPTVTLDANTGEPSISIPSTLAEPTTVQSETLIQGGGAQVEKGSYVLVNYKGVRWADGSEYASSWPVGTAPFSTQIGTGQVIPAWDLSLLDQTVGSQVLIVAPPEFGYPAEGTLVFVVDILDAWTPVE